MKPSSLTLVLMLASCTPPAKDPPPPEPGCEVSQTAVDFGEVESRELGRSLLLIRNLAQRARRVDIAAPLPPFTLTQPPGRVSISALGSHELIVNFQPNDGLLHLGELTITESNPAPDGEKCDFTIPLSGLGAGGVSIEPTTIDFGHIEPGEIATREIRLHSSRRTPVSFNTLIDPTGGFIGSSLISLSPASGDVPPLGTVVVTLSAEGRIAGVRRGTLTIFSRDAITGRPLNMGGELPSQFTIKVGKPAAQVDAPGVDPWRVGFEATSMPASFSTRRIAVTNVGTSGDVEELALAFGLPSVTIESIRGSPSELSIETPSLSTGLLQGRKLELALTLTPISLGPKEFKVQLLTNDPVQPMRELMVRATAETLPACTMTSPPNVAAMALIPDGGAEASITFTNEGSTPCLVDDLHLESNTAPGYFISSSSAPQVEIAPGGSHVVTVAGPFRTYPGRVGYLEFHIFNRDSHAELINVYFP